MSKEKLYGLRDQLSKFLYDPTPKQMVERKIMPKLRAAASSQTRHGRTTMNNVVRMFDDNFK